MMVEIELILSATLAETTLEKEAGINIFQLFQRIFDNLAGDQIHPVFSIQLVFFTETSSMTQILYRVRSFCATKSTFEKIKTRIL